MTTASTSTARVPHPTQPGRGPALVSAGAGAAFVVLLVLAGLLDPGYSPVSEAISALASTESHSAALMTAGFACLGLTSLATGVALLHALRGGLARTAAVLVLLAGVATLGDGWFRQSCSSLQQECLRREASGDVSGAHVLHNLIALPLFLMLVVAAFLLALVARRTTRLHFLGRPALIGACLTLLFFVWFGSGAYGSLGGLVQRALVLLGYGLPLVVALAATSGAPTDADS